jgi:hypothetical protein
VTGGGGPAYIVPNWTFEAVWRSRNSEQGAFTGPSKDGRARKDWPVKFRLKRKDE